MHQVFKKGTLRDLREQVAAMFKYKLVPLFQVNTHTDVHYRQSMT